MSRIVTRGLQNPSLSNQWHLTQVFKGDPNRVWSEFTGANVRVGVYDDGIDKSHVDLRGRYDATREVMLNGIRQDPSLGSNSHGTAVAGLIAAEANNGVGGVGVAHGASLTGVNIFSGALAGSGFLVAARAMSTFDVTNNSWGWSSRYADPSSQPGSFGGLFHAALKAAADTGRGGLGTVIVNAVGNDWGVQTNANMSGFNSSRYTISVGAVGQDGDVSGYSNRGAAVFISGPSNGGGAGMFTTDQSGRGGYSAGDFTSSFGGTSAAAPVVSGVVALMLSANRNLGWRDVQDILAFTADHTTPASLNGQITGRMAFGWQVNNANNINGGGLHYSNDVGFGRVDAFEAVRFAEVWNRFAAPQTSANEQIASVSGQINRALRDQTTTEFQVAFNRAIEIETVSLTLTLTHQNVNDLRIELVSPEGTRSVLLSPSSGGQSMSGFTWSFATEALRGEMANGNWTVRVTDTRAGATGAVSSYKLDVTGDAPSINDVYHYTDSFTKLLALDPNRAILRDTDGGIDWINLAGATENIVLNLNAGVGSTMGGRAFITIAQGTLIENAVTGDGHDVIMGNSGNNLLIGMRGNDTLLGGAGDDILEGGMGNDDLNGGTGNDRLNGGAGDDRLFGGAGFDLFSFDTHSFGADLITDFQDGLDRIDFRGLGLTLQSILVADTGNGAVIRAAGGSIVVTGINVGMISAADFILF